MRKIMMFSCAMLILVPWLQAQETGKIEGMVTTSNGPFAGVSISLLRAKDSSLVKLAVTSAKGDFSINSLQDGHYLLKISAVGFKEQTNAPIEISANKKVVKIPLITLEATGADLGVVQVTATRPLIEHKIDKTIVNVEASVTNIGSTALEVLERSPGVTVDRDGNISLKGKQGVIILLDGKPTYLGSADLANLLRNMNAAQLDQIEIMSQPSAKFDASGNSGVINIKTKRQQLKGFNGTVGANYIQGVYARGGANISLNARKDKLNVFFTYNYFHFEGFNTLNIVRKFRDANTKEVKFIMDQTSEGKFSGDPHSVKLGMDIFATEKTTFGFVASGFYNQRQGKTVSLAAIKNRTQDVLSYNSAISTTDDPWKNYSVNLNFRHAFNKKGHEITADADHVYYNTLSTQYSDNDSLDQFGHSLDNRFLLRGNLPSEIKIYTGRLDYTYPMKGEMKLEAGAKVSLVQTDNDAQFTHFDKQANDWVFDQRSNHFIYDENINAAYVNMNRQMKKWGVQLGLRLENTNAKGRQLQNSKNFNRNYTQLFPTSYISYKLNDKNNFGLSYGRRIERPNYQDMNPFQYLLDRYTYREGNPNLTPQFSHNIELSYNYKGQLNTSVNFTQTRDIINDILKQDDETKTTFQTKENIARRTNIGLAISYNKALVKWWNISAFGNVFYNQFEGMVNNAWLEASLTGFLMNVSNQFRFNKGWSAELSGWFRSRSLEGGLILAEPMGMFSLGASKQVLKDKGTVRLNIRDPFWLQRFRGSTRFENIDAQIRSEWDNRQVTVGFTYRFGKNQKNVPAPRRKTGASQEEQNRVGSNNQ